MTSCFSVRDRRVLTESDAMMGCDGGAEYLGGLVSMESRQERRMSQMNMVHEVNCFRR